MVFICHLIKPLSDSILSLFYIWIHQGSEETGPNDGNEVRQGFEVSGLLTRRPGSLHATLQKAVEAGFIEGGCVTSSAVL